MTVHGAGNNVNQMYTQYESIRLKIDHQWDRIQQPCILTFAFSSIPYRFFCSCSSFIHYSLAILVCIKYTQKKARSKWKRHQTGDINSNTCMRWCQNTWHFLFIKGMPFILLGCNDFRVPLYMDHNSAESNCTNISKEKWIATTSNFIFVTNKYPQWLSALHLLRSSKYSN